MALVTLELFGDTYFYGVTRQCVVMTYVSGKFQGRKHGKLVTHWDRCATFELV